MMLKTLTTALALAFAGGLAHAQEAPMSAQSAGVPPGETRILGGLSTYGLVVGHALGVSENMAVRTQFAYASHGSSFTHDGRVYDLSVSSPTIMVMSDYQLGGSGFAMSLGMTFGGYKGDMSINDPIYGGVFLPGEYLFTVERQATIAPTVSTSYHRSLSDRFSIGAELGASFGRYAVKATLPDNLPPEGRDFADDILIDVNNKISGYNVTPFASLGVSFNF